MIDENKMIVKYRTSHDLIILFFDLVKFNNNNNGNKLNVLVTKNNINIYIHYVIRMS